jgi:hypothetical protein
LAFNEQIELFSGGFKLEIGLKTKDISFGMYQEFDFMMFMPKDIAAILALEGKQGLSG